MFNALTHSFAATGTFPPGNIAVGADKSAGIVIQLTGTFVGTLTWEGSLDGTNWVALTAPNVNTGTGTTTLTAAGIVRVDCTGFLYIRVRCSAYTSGTLVVSVQPYTT